MRKMRFDLLNKHLYRINRLFTEKTDNFTESVRALNKGGYDSVKLSVERLVLDWIVKSRLIGFFTTSIIR